jgi:hypothetical protein
MQMRTRPAPSRRVSADVNRRAAGRPAHRHLLRAATILLLSVVVLWAVSAVATYRLAPRVIQDALPALEAALRPLGVGLSAVSFDDLRLAPSLTGLAVRNLRARLDLNPRDRIELASEVAVDRLDVSLNGIRPLAGRIQATGLEIRLDPADRPQHSPFDRVENGAFSMGNLPLTRLEALAEAMRAQLRDLFVENHAIGDVDFSGDVVLDIDGVSFWAHLYTERQGEEFRLRFRASDIQNISDQTGMALVAEQIEIVSLYPLRAPAILLLTERARKLARLHEPDDDWMQDAHRHVTWSFLLTQAFGPDFATQVTNAQERRPGNTPNERAMDYHNNAVGRQLVADRVALATLPARVRSDPSIIRHPDEVERFATDQLLR